MDSGQLLEQFKTYLEKDKSPSTIQSYVYLIRKWLKYLYLNNILIEDSAPKHVKVFLKSISTSRITRRQYTIAIIVFYDFLTENLQMFGHNEMRRELKLSKPGRKITTSPFNNYELSLLFDSLRTDHWYMENIKDVGYIYRPEYYCLARYLYETGSSLKKALDLKVGNLDYDNLSIESRKVLKELIMLKPNKSKVFDLNYNTVLDLFGKLGKSLGFPVSVTRFRATWSKRFAIKTISYLKPKYSRR